MRKQVLVLSDGSKYRFVGSIVASVHQQANIIRRGCHDREMVNHRLYQIDDYTFLLIIEKHWIGSDTKELAIHPFAWIDALSRFATKDVAAQLLNQFLSLFSVKNSEQPRPPVASVPDPCVHRAFRRAVRVVSGWQATGRWV